VGAGGLGGTWGGVVTALTTLRWIGGLSSNCRGPPELPPPSPPPMPTTVCPPQGASPRNFPVISHTWGVGAGAGRGRWRGSGGVDLAAPPQPVLHKLSHFPGQSSPIGTLRAPCRASAAPALPPPHPVPLTAHPCPMLFCPRAWDPGHRGGVQVPELPPPCHRLPVPRPKVWGGPVQVRHAVSVSSSSSGARHRCRRVRRRRHT
jgi:hypothetical protein